MLSTTEIAGERNRGIIAKSDPRFGGQFAGFTQHRCTGDHPIFRGEDRVRFCCSCSRFSLLSFRFAQREESSVASAVAGWVLLFPNLYACGINVTTARRVSELTLLSNIYRGN